MHPAGITPADSLRTDGLVRGRFVMRDRTLVAETRGWGRSVHTIQQMPVAAVRNADETMRAIVQPPGALSIKGDVA